MPAPTCTADFVAVLRKSRLVADAALDSYLAARPAAAENPAELAAALKADGVLTEFQTGQLLRGRHKGFVLGKYRLLDRIGMGGMGQVYLAEHTAMRRRVAVKVLPPDRSESPFARERFLREARAAAAVEHPNLIRAYDIEFEGEVQFLVMEYLDGVSLHDLVARRGPISAERAAHYLYQAAAGLSSLHARSLVHRDVKPANLLLDRTGNVKVLDLGLVRSELDDDALTRGEGAKIVGTADYLAPEQAIDCSKVDNRADVYSLGATAYYLLTGAPPFKAEKISQKLVAHQLQEPKPIHLVRPGVPLDLSAVVHKMLAKKPHDRFPSAVEVMAALEPWLMSPVGPPDDDDFPARPGVSAASGMSFAAHSAAGSTPGMAPVRAESKPIMRGLTGGSVIRIAPNKSKPASPSDQPTVANHAEETGVDHPRAKPTSRPFARPAAKPTAATQEARIAAIFGPQAASRTAAAEAPPARGRAKAYGLAAVLFAAAATGLSLWAFAR